MSDPLDELASASQSRSSSQGGHRGVSRYTPSPNNTPYIWLVVVGAIFAIIVVLFAVGVFDNKKVQPQRQQNVANQESGREPSLAPPPQTMPVQPSRQTRKPRATQPALATGIPATGPAIGSARTWAPPPTARGRPRNRSSSTTRLTTMAGFSSP